MPINKMEKVERKPRQVVEVGLSLLAHVSMPHKFWKYVFLIATYIINKLPPYNSSDL